jgi:chromosome segregation ATPase
LLAQHLTKVRKEHASSQAAHDKKRHTLDLRLVDIEDLRKQLADKTEALAVAEAHVHSQRGQESAITALAAIKADFGRVKEKAEELGRDLRTERARYDEAERRQKMEGKQVKRELEEAQRAKKQAGAEARVLRERVGELEDEKKTWQGHKCTV